jgi:hypothetical protein
VSEPPSASLIIVITFLIQAAGGGLSTSTNISQAQTGGNIFLAGIAIQMASFALFSAMWILFIVRVYVLLRRLELMEDTSMTRHYGTSQDGSHSTLPLDSPVSAS